MAKPNPIRTKEQGMDTAAREFDHHWKLSTADSNLSLHGFRRFKTTHLLNLRYLESDIAKLDEQIYQAGLSLNLELSSQDRLGLGACRPAEDVPPIEDVITQDLVRSLRSLIKEYDEAMINFNAVMSMETFSLLDDEKHSSLNSDRSLYELYKTRLLRIDQPPRGRQDPLQRRTHQMLRDLRYWRMARSSSGQGANPEALNQVDFKSSQNTSLIADIISRTIMAAVVGVFLTVPLVTLSREPRESVKLGVISACIILFAVLVSVSLRASNLEMMVVTAAYAAVVAVFVSDK